MSGSASSDFRRLRVIVLVQGIAGALAFMPLVLLAGMAFDKDLSRPENVTFALWAAAAVCATMFNVLGGVALYYRPRRRLIIGSLAVSGLLLATMLVVFS